MPRPRKGGLSRRVQLRISDQNLSLYDSYSPDELSELMNRALQSMTPGIALGDRLASVVRPVTPVSALLVRLFVRQTQIQLLYPEPFDAFIDEVKALGYRWVSPYWLKTCEPDDRVDRAAEAAHRLLLAGFCVQVESEAVKHKAIAATYEPEHYRRVDASQLSPWLGWFEITWPRSDELFDEAQKITGAKWADRAMRVPPEMYREVQDFADANDFWLTSEAEILMQKAEQAWEEMTIVDPAEHRKRQRRTKRQQPPSPNLAEIPDDLRDDD